MVRRRAWRETPQTSTGGYLNHQAAATPDA